LHPNQKQHDPLHLHHHIWEYHHLTPCTQRHNNTHKMEGDLLLPDDIPLPSFPIIYNFSCTGQDLNTNPRERVFKGAWPMFQPQLDFENRHIKNFFRLHYSLIKNNIISLVIYILLQLPKFLSRSDFIWHSYTLSENFQSDKSSLYVVQTKCLSIWSIGTTLCEQRCIQETDVGLMHHTLA